MNCVSLLKCDRSFLGYSDQDLPVSVRTPHGVCPYDDLSAIFQDTSKYVCLINYTSHPAVFRDGKAAHASHVVFASTNDNMHAYSATIRGKQTGK